MKYTTKGEIKVHCITFGEPAGLRGPSQAAVEIVVEDTGCGIPPAKLQTIFKEFEQVEYSSDSADVHSGAGTGLGKCFIFNLKILPSLTMLRPRTRGRCPNR